MLKKSKYTFFEEIDKGIYLHYSPMTNRFLLLNQNKHHLLDGCANGDLDSLPQEFKDLLFDNGFIVNDDVDETKMVLDRRLALMEDKSMYNVVLNTTLDCNLSCWYCYENRIAGSFVSDKVIEAIKKNIIDRYETHPFATLKVSFFGGEPFLYFKGIRQLLDFSKTFCADRDIELIADFTTNATLLTPQIIDYLSQYRCHFQITLDGCEQHHNAIKVDKVNKINTYRKTIATLKDINDKIENRLIALRINFDNQTLKGISEILGHVDFLDRTKSYIILKKVWQLPTDKVDKEALVDALQLVLDSKFLADYYVMPKGSVCFAEREGQVLFNYDGGIFKCTTICSFDHENSLGELDYETGKIKWNTEKITDWYADMQPRHCKDCKWFPACLGPCNRQLIAHNQEKICTFDAFNLTEAEYLMYLFKYNLLLKELSHQKP